MPAGDVSNAPIAAIPPAFATATDRLAGQAPAIGASRIGSSRPYPAQNAVARASGLTTYVPACAVAPTAQRGGSSKPSTPRIVPVAGMVGRPESETRWRFRSAG